MRFRFSDRRRSKLGLDADHDDEAIQPRLKVMADALAHSSTTFAPGKAVELAQKALTANQALQHELTVRAEQLELELLEADRLLVRQSNADVGFEQILKRGYLSQEALENGTDPEEAEDEIQIPGARRAFSMFPMSECLNTVSEVVWVYGVP